ncbi:MAG: hypothetical protein AB1465_06095 [Patescibacteria group bacterium]
MQKRKNYNIVLHNLLNNCRQTLRPRRGAFGKPNPAEYKPELTVVGRDENFLYVFGLEPTQGRLQRETTIM